MTDELMRHAVTVADYMPHGMCLLWQPWLVFLWAGSDALIFASYMAIPVALLMVLRRRKDVPHRGIVMLFASFILLCGFTHLFGIVTLWVPIYPYVGALKLATGIVSTITAILLFRMIPALVALPSPGDLRRANEELREARDALEAKVDERTAELSDANAKLAILTREAVHRSNNLLAVVSSLARQSARDAKDIESYVETFAGRIDALAGATSSIMRGDDKTSQGVETIVRRQLEPLLAVHGDKVRIEGPLVRIGSEAAQQISLALHELSTNAQKYGGLDHDEAEIVVRWHVEDGRFKLVWCETFEPTAGPAPFSGERIGFGTKLLVRVVPTMLRGKAERNVDEAHFIYSLDVPVDGLGAGSEGQGETGIAARIVDETFGA
ncbi:sensor histidine kinase [Sphingomicrobium aestuariivivum]|uniref:sensor histidine kinase n=1 Tax=Sphingomicrobium aestuariivivum TaxID=1582356 RepID=UPI001FD663F8|nr:sensor histidine kinase [Sphingomicrobium aestuariivivum]MCJ8190494.1 sensor histidine kinase [Sphingomicrobium aestuariivivum]